VKGRYVKKIKAPPNWEDPPKSFERFEKMVKGLMAVPKKELDKELAKDERKKEQSKKTRRR
jgi:hypothetical protein